MPYRYKYRRGYRSRQLRRYNRTVQPDKKFVTVTFKYGVRISANNGTYSGNLSIIRCNNPYDPVFGIGTNYPVAYPYEAYGYERVMCYASTIRATFIAVLGSSEAQYVGVIPQMGNSLPSVTGSTVSHKFKTLPYARYRLLGTPSGGRNAVTVKSSWDIRRDSGLKVGDWLNQTTYAQDTYDDVDLDRRYMLFIAAADEASGYYTSQAINCQVTVRYKLMFYQRKNNVTYDTALAEQPSLMIAPNIVYEKKEEEQLPEGTVEVIHNG